MTEVKITREEAIKEAKRFIELLPKNIRIVSIDENYNLKIGIKDGTTPLNHNRLGALGWIVSHFELTKDEVNIKNDN